MSATDAPPMQALFHTQGLGVRTVIEIGAVGFPVLVVLEVGRQRRAARRRHSCQCCLLPDGTHKEPS